MLPPLFVVALVAGAAPTQAEVARLTPRQKAALVVVSGQPAPRGVGGIFVRPWNRHLPRPRGTLVFADQEGGSVRGLPGLPPARAAADYVRVVDAFAAGRRTGRALRGAGVHVDFAPVLDAPSGPLGSRHFRRFELGVAFARGLARERAGACAKHFPGLGSAPVSTDVRPRVHARIRPDELAAFRAAIRARVPCVMTSHAFYDRLGGRASVSPATYRLLRRLGFDGVAITDSLSVVRGPWPVLWARRAIRAGADMILFTSAADARRAIVALVPLARRGELDAKVRRILRWRRALLSPPHG